jgi:hypothetical protein
MLWASCKDYDNGTSHESDTFKCTKTGMVFWFGEILCFSWQITCTIDITRIRGERNVKITNVKKCLGLFGSYIKMHCVSDSPFQKGSRALVCTYLPHVSTQCSYRELLFRKCMHVRVIMLLKCFYAYQINLAISLVLNVFELLHNIIF